MLSNPEVSHSCSNPTKSKQTDIKQRAPIPCVERRNRERHTHHLRQPPGNQKTQVHSKHAMMMGSPLWLLPVVLTTTASRPYVGTWQLNDSYTAPPYDRRLFSFVPGFHEGHMQRDVKCRDDHSWRWQWRPAGDAAPD